MQLTGWSIGQRVGFGNFFIGNVFGLGSAPLTDTLESAIKYKARMTNVGRHAGKAEAMQLLKQNHGSAK
jgi:hypothetical protein